MHLAQLLGIGFAGTFVWPISPDAAAAVYAAARVAHPLAVGVTLAVGQGCAHAVLFTFGGQLRRRWPWFDRQCQRVRERHATRLGRGAAVLGVTSGLLGLPPTSITAALAPGLEISAARLLPLLFAMRVVRFTVLASLATGAIALVGHG